MAYTPIPDYVTNQLITAAHGNTYWKNNFAALWVYEANGDVAYRKTTTTLGVLPLSDKRGIGQYLVQAQLSVSVADGVGYFPPMPETMNGWNLYSVYATVITKSTSGNPTIQIARGRRANPTSAHTWVDVLSTLITIDANEYSSLTAAVQPVINASYDDVLTDDLYRIDVDVAGTGTKGLFVGLVFTIP